MTIWSDNAARAATTAASAIDAERNAGVRGALGFLKCQQPGDPEYLRAALREQALYILASSVDSQARMAGVAGADVADSAERRGVEVRLVARRDVDAPVPYEPTPEGWAAL